MYSVLIHVNVMLYSILSYSYLVNSNIKMLKRSKMIIRIS